MRQSQICYIICCSVAYLACATDYGFGKLPVPIPRRLPVEGFPAKIGDWQAGPILPVDPDVQATLPSAKILERVYTDNANDSFDLTLVTANDDLDIHDPSVCLPAQGWKIDDITSVAYGNQPATLMDVSQDDQKMAVLYWFTGYYPPKLSSHFWVQDAYHLRSKIVKGREGESLMVRILSTEGSNSPDSLQNFTEAILPAIKKITK
jgi:hypothetical protein